MKLEDIKAAVDAGITVHWAHIGYEVIKDKLGQYLIIHTANEDCISLTHQDGKTLNGKPSQFFIPKDELNEVMNKAETIIHNKLYKNN